MFNKKVKNSGITLIALVITIIVLLILAGVSIATLTGNNGIIQKTADAKIRTNKTKEVEQARLDIMSIITEKKGEDPTEKEVKDIIGIYFTSVPENLEDLTQDLTTKDGGYNVKLAEVLEGVIIKEEYNPELLTLEGTPKNTDKYGWKVKNYTVTTDTFESGVWRLFYQDENYAYLITDAGVASFLPKSEYNGVYTSGEEISIEGRKLNSRISSLFTNESSRYNENILATVWITDTSPSGPWAQYKNSDAVFAIGGPTAELFAKSFNNRSNKTSNQITLTVGAYGYTENTGYNWFVETENHAIYRKHVDSDNPNNKSSTWWIASPWSTSSADTLLYVNTYKFYGAYTYNTYANVRPVVCIPSSVFDRKYATEDNLVDE